MAGASKKSYINKNGKKVTYYTSTYYDIFKVQHTSGHFKNKADAIKHGSELENCPIDVVNITFEQLFKPYIELVLPKYSHTTQSTYMLYITNHFTKLFPLKYDKVSSLDLQKFIDNIEQTHTPYVAQLCLKIARAVCNYAKKHKLIRENKFTSVDNVTVSPKEKHHLTEIQEKEILKCCKELYPKYYALFCTLMGTGMRIGEALALEISDINFESRSINVNKQFTKGQLKNGTKNPARIVKTTERDVYITDDIIAVLQEHIKSLSDGTKLLFPSQINGYLSDNNLRRRVWNPLLAYVGITNRVRIHDLRGSYADIAYSHGATITFVQNQLGHQKADTLLNVYMKNSPTMIDSALKNMNGIFVNKDENNDEQI